MLKALIIAVVAASLAVTLATAVTESHGQTVNLITNFGNIESGFKITTNGFTNASGLTNLTVNLYIGTTPTKLYIYNTSSATSAQCSNTSVTDRNPKLYDCLLKASTAYYVVVSNATGGYNANYSSTARSFPQTKVYTTWNGRAYRSPAGTGTFTEDSTPMSIESLTFDLEQDAFITLNNTKPDDGHFMNTTTPVINVTVAANYGTWNLSLMMNGATAATNNSVTTTGNYSFYPTLTAGTLYNWYIKATNTAAPTQTSNSTTSYLYVTGTSAPASCVVDLGLAYYRPNDCQDI